MGLRLLLGMLQARPGCDGTSSSGAGPCSEGVIVEGAHIYLCTKKLNLCPNLPQLYMYCFTSSCAYSSCSHERLPCVCVVVRISVDMSEYILHVHMSVNKCRLIGIFLF